MKLSIETLEEMVELQKGFKELYNSTGLVGISNNQIQLEFKDFMDTFQTYSYKARDSEGFPHRLTAVAGGVAFVTIAKDEELELLKDKPT